MNRTTGTARWKFVGPIILLLGWGANLSLADDQADAVAKKSNVDARTLHHKVLCGYQGWFRCPGDGTEEGWLHWSRNQNRLTPDSVTVEMWPDTSECGEKERYTAPGFTGTDQQPAFLFSSANTGSFRNL